MEQIRHESKVLLLGDARLYKKSRILEEKDLPLIQSVVQQLHEVLFEFKAKYGAFRAIAAPQLGYQIRLIYMHIDKPVVIINPKFSYLSKEKFEVWDDCMCFPNLLVKVARHRHCVMDYYNDSFEAQQIKAKDSIAELLQHEYDHLEGILATQRAINTQAYRWRNTYG